MSEDEEFGSWLRQQRTQVLGWTQAELAREAFCSETMIRKIERGHRQPARELAERLLRAMRVPENDLPGHVAWARGLAAKPAPDEAQRAIQFGGSGNTIRTVLVPLEAIASFGSEEPRIVRLAEPFLGRIQWAAVPLASLVPEQPMSHCTGEGCNGLDPEVAGCSQGSITIDGEDIIDPVTKEIIANLELRFSRLCQTNWVRITRFARRPFRMEAYLRNEDGEILEPTRVVVEPDRVYGYGAMWYAPTGRVVVRACGKVEGVEEVRTRLH